MANERSRFATLAIIAAATSLISGRDSFPLVTKPPADWNSIYVAVVKTDPKLDDTQDRTRLIAFDKELRDCMKVADIQERYVGCYGCDQLPNNMPTDGQLKFIFYREHLDNMYAFTSAMKRVQESASGHANFKLTYTAEQFQTATCLPSCIPKAICTQYGRCDGKPGTNACDPCPSP